METNIRQIKQYTENQINIFSRAECPHISGTFKKIYDTITQLENITKRTPLTAQTANLYKNTLDEIENTYKKLVFFGHDFTERINKYKKFKSDLELTISQTIYKYRQDSSRI